MKEAVDFMAHLAEGFWGCRYELDDDDFAYVGEGSTPTPDPVGEGTWSHIMGLADDVAIRTTRFQGRYIERANAIATTWGEMCGYFTLVDGAPRGATQSTLFLLNEEFEASLYSCVTGWYRQAFQSLRTALELGLAGPYFDIGRPEQLSRWQAPEGDIGTPSVGQASDVLETVLAPAFEAAAVSSPFSKKAWVRGQYRYLSDFSHGRPEARGGGANSMAGQNASIWSSNGPVYVPSAVRQWYAAFSATAAALAVIAGAAYPVLPRMKGPWDASTWLDYTRRLLDWSSNRPDWAEPIVARW